MVVPNGRNPAPPRASQDDPALLVLLVDINHHLWQPPVLTPLDFVTQLYSFINAFFLTHEGNRLAVLSVGDRSADWVYLPPELDDDDNEIHAAASKEGGGVTTSASASVSSARVGLSPAEQVMRGLAAILHKTLATNDTTTTAPLPLPSEPAVAAALSRALCLANRCTSRTDLFPHIRPRILLIHGSPDSPSQYVPIMNAAFAAQRASIPLDLCLTTDYAYAFLPQISDISNGICRRADRPSTLLLQYLLTTFAPDEHSRSVLRGRVPADTRVPCFCHSTPIDRGYVCSVCLSVFCEPRGKCLTCGVQFTSQVTGHVVHEG